MMISNYSLSHFTLNKYSLYKLFLEVLIIARRLYFNILNINTKMYESKNQILFPIVESSKSNSSNCYLIINKSIYVYLINSVKNTIIFYFILQVARMTYSVFAVFYQRRE